jgi:hypothetical protein
MTLIPSLVLHVAQVADFLATVSGDNPARPPGQFAKAKLTALASAAGVRAAFDNAPNFTMLGHVFVGFPA